MLAAPLVETPSPALLDITAPDFAISGPQVCAARGQYWRAETLLGPAVLDRDAVRTLLLDRRLGQGSATRLDLQGVPDGPLLRWWKTMILNLDGPAHERLRRLIAPAFGPQVVDPLRPRMRGHIQATMVPLFAGLDSLADSVTCDAVSAIADRYPMAVLGTLLGIPPAEMSGVARASADLGLAFGFTVADDLERIESALQHLYGVADRLVDGRRREPGEDLLSRLVAAGDGADRLTAQELRDLVVTVIFAGHDTTKQQLALALYAFASRPGDWDLLASRPDLAAAAVDEVLRVAPTVPLISRVALEDMTFRDLHLPAGSRLVLIVSSANTDPAALGDASFDITQRRPRSMSFGGGTHHCLGHLIARAALEEALPLLAASVTDLRPAGPVLWRPPTGVTGPASLPVRFRLRD